MDKVIGLGEMGVRLAEELSEHPEYRIYKIGTHLKERGTLALDPCDNMEEYEKNFDAEEAYIYLRSIKDGDHVLVATGGGEAINGVLLRLLETISHAKLNVLYVCPDRTMMSHIERRDDKIAFKVLQEYARSGILEQLLLVDRPTVESYVGDVPIQEYEKSVAHLIAYGFAMVNYYNHTDPVLSTSLDTTPWSRMSSFGLSSLEEDQGDVRLFFPLSEPNSYHFFYGIPASMMESDGSLMQKIKSHVKRYKTETASASFSVYETTFENIMVLCAGYTDKIQDFAQHS
jgi:shikimate kinase